MNNKYIKIPFVLVLGIAIGFLTSRLFLFSKTTDDSIVEKNTVIADTLKSDVIYEVFQPYIPEELTFCGEKVPLENFDVHESLDFEIIANTYRHSSTLLYIKRANRYFPEIEKILKANNIPDDMKYLCVAESGLSNAISPSGATGFWQIMKATGEEYKLTINKSIDERYNQAKSLSVAIKYLKSAYKKFGSWTLAAASYNMGQGGLKKNIDHQRINSYWDLHLNTETARYVYRILALKLIMSQPEKYGFNISKEHLYAEIPTYEVTVDTTVDDLVKFAFNNKVNYKILKYFNPWLRADNLVIHGNQEYKITLPKSGVRKCEIPKEEEEKAEN
ncbi:lytic transglycosylase domain-containing protein [Bacteroidales bacterium OttesenSCG-928-I21]|nr:lytic transglycosylase domain-containing protein [Bacteroidales bacterium OttesenSCG-928-I21]